MSRLLLDALQELATQRPEEVFCHFLKRGTCQAVTYGDLARRALAFRDLYGRRGLAEGTPVLIVLEHCPELLPSFLGAVLAGCIPSFMPFPTRKQSADRYWSTHSELFTRIGAAAIMTWPENAKSLESTLAQADLSILHPEQALMEQSGALRLEDFPRVDRSRVMVLQHSSGTTGLKKGVELSYGAIADHVASVSKAIECAPGDRIATWLPLYHDMGLIACFVLPLTLGISIVMLDPFEWVARPEQILDAMSHFRCTHTWWPNFAFHHVCRNADGEVKYDLSHVKAFINCSEPCKREAFERFLACHGRHGVRREQLQVSYGMAEVVFCMTQTRVGSELPSVIVDRDELVEQGRAVAARPDGPACEVLSAGKAIDGIEFVIVDGDGQPLPDDHVGEVITRGRFLFSGYFRNEEETARKLRDGWYWTGDLAFRRGDELFVMGRKDDRIIVCGKNFFAHDIEYIASAVPGVKPGRTVAIGVFSEEIGSEEVIVIAETEEPEGKRRLELRHDIKLAIIEHLNLTPRDVLVVSAGWITKTTSGKMSRTHNYARYQAQLAVAEARAES